MILLAVTALVGVFILLINVIMPIIFGILTFMSRINFELSWAEHGFLYNLGAWFVTLVKRNVSLYMYQKHNWFYLLFLFLFSKTFMNLFTCEDFRQRYDIVLVALTVSPIMFTNTWLPCWNGHKLLKLIEIIYSYQCIQNIAMPFWIFYTYT